MEEPLFEESQKFNQWWMILFFIFFNFFVLSSIFNLFSNDTFGENRIVAIIFALIILLVDYLLLSMKLNTKIYKEYILIKFFPFIRNKKIYFSEIESFEIRKYNPIREYGGWGYRIGIFGKGIAYNIKGNMGLQLIYKNKKKLLIGTQKPEELKQVLSNHVSSLIKE